VQVRQPIAGSGRNLSFIKKAPFAADRATLGPAIKTVDACLLTTVVDPWSNMPSPHEPAKRRLTSRARYACQRCRAQKLRCENIRPCPTCFRLGIECRETSARASAHIGQSSRPAPPSPATQASREALQPHPTPSSSAPLAISPAESHGSPVVYSQRPSTYEAADQVFRQSHRASALFHAADAIPGGSEATKPGPQGSDLGLTDILGLDVPPLHVVDFLLDTYLSSVHWFMSVLHEPTLRAEIHRIWASGVVPEHRKLVPILVLMILSFSARYASPELGERACPGFDIASMEPVWLKRVEEKLLDALEDGGLEAVQIAILLKSYYLYGNRPKRSFAILGAGIKVALSMKLHLEHTWTTTDLVRRQVMRRVWWSLYVADVWAATIYGTPCNIHDDDWDVEIPETIDDGMPRYPGSTTHELYEGKDFGPLTIFSYQRYKFRLYKLAFSIINNVYSHQRTTLSDTINNIRRLDERLLQWEEHIPPELRISSLKTGSETPSEALRTFHRQAVVLQLSFDNFRLLLHRPLLTLNRLQQPLGGLDSVSNDTALIDEMIKNSKYRCWDAAMRTSRIGQHTRTLGGMRYTLGASYIMIQAFTAAVALGIFALSDPASRQAYEAKGAISRILGFPKLYGYRSVIFDQCTAILEELIRLILNEEMRSLVSNQATENVANEALESSAVQATFSDVDGNRNTTNGGYDAGLPSLGMTDDISWGNFSDALVSVHDGMCYVEVLHPIANTGQSSVKLGILPTSVSRK
jgi:hypothetical protein